MFTRKKNFGERLKELFGLGAGSDTFYEDLEDTLLEADLGTKVTMELLEAVRAGAREQRLKSAGDLEALVRNLLVADLKTVDLSPEPGKVTCFLFFG